MEITKISDNVQALLESTDYFVSVIPGPPEGARVDEDGNLILADNSFEGYPSASHYYVDTVGDYATVRQNRRVIQYIVELYIVPGNNTAFKDLLRTDSYPLIDNVMNLFDQSIALGNSDLDLTPACDILKPAPGRLDPVQTPEGKGVMMTITLYCEADVTFRNN